MRIFKKFMFIFLWFLYFSWITFANSTDLLEKIWGNHNWEIQIWDNLWNFILNISTHLIDIFFIIAIIYFFIITIKLIMAENSDDEASNFKKGFIWISIWLIVMQLAKLFVKSLTNTESIETAQISNLPNIATDLLNNIIKPLTALLETGAAFLFVLIWIYAFFKLITSNWNEDEAKNWKMMVFYSIIWFIIIKVSSTLINAVYWNCETWATGQIFWVWKCSNLAEPSEISNIIISFINWLNSFIWIWIILMVIYAWLQIIFSKWDEEKLNTWKKSIGFIAIWVWIIITNYLILTFFLR